MRIGILTSSRADYGIYLPLLNKIKKDSFFSLEIIAFGTHVSNSHGYTVKDIEKDGFSIIHKIASFISNDDAQSIASSYGLTALKFADFWAEHHYDMVFCLGDRFEMNAAVQAGIPLGVKFAHIHGGETTLGAIDNIYRHQISLASSWHFTATSIFSDKVATLLNTKNNVYTVGSLSIDELASFSPMEKELFLKTYSIPDKDYALITFHPETISFEHNFAYARSMKNALLTLAKDLFLVITMPNADTLGSIYRDEIMALKKESPENVLLIENFGKNNYFSAMRYAKVMIGNTSSGIIEAASFGKYVVNVGDRQKGRVQSQNVFDVPFDEKLIVEKTHNISGKGEFVGDNVYSIGGTADAIIKIIKDVYENL